MFCKMLCSLASLIVKHKNGREFPDNNRPNLKVRSSPADRQVNTHDQQLNLTDCRLIVESLSTAISVLC